MSDHAVAELVRRLARRAKIARFSPHDMRRTFIGDLLDGGAAQVHRDTRRLSWRRPDGREPGA
jgi:integrase